MEIAGGYCLRGTVSIVEIEISASFRIEYRLYRTGTCTQIAVGCALITMYCVDQRRAALGSTAVFEEPLVKREIGMRIYQTYEDKSGCFPFENLCTPGDGS